MISRMFGWLKSRTLWVLIGIIAAILLIWYIGPLFAFGSWRPLGSTTARYWAIGLLLGYFLLKVLLALWRAKNLSGKVGTMFRASLAPRPDSGDSEQVGALRERFDEALKILRRARFDSSRPSLWARVMRRGRYVYELPWYIIIGAPGAGKTTALLNSGLSFPLAQQFGRAALRGAGGTRNCDWWFTNEAVFIDTAGRYTTHESDAEADKIEWAGFLGLLKKYRTRRPINGVLVTLSVSELLESEPDARSAHAAAIRQRLDEVRGVLGISFPVYLLVNKCDLLLGFDEYFASLDRAARDQVWGVTFPLDDPERNTVDQSQVRQELGLLQERIDEGLIDTLQDEPDLQRRSLIYVFPQQFAALGEVLTETLGEIFAESRYSSAPLLRGVYFTSGTQQGAPLDRALSALGKLFELKRSARNDRGTAKSYFLQELLSKVVFVEAHLAGANRRVDQRSRALHLGAYALSCGALVAAAAAWSVAYRNNLTYIAEVDSKTAVLAQDLDEMPAAGSNLFALLPVLTAAERVPDSTHFTVQSPLMPWTFGLYQGEKLEAGARPIYRKLLTERFAPTLKARLEQLLRSVAVEDLEFAFEILKAYLMMHDPERFNADEFVAFVLADWDYNMPQGAGLEERAAVERHVRALVGTGSLLSTTPVDGALVQATRSRLVQFSLSQRIYRRLTRVLADNQLPNFSLAAVVGPQAPSVFRRISGRSLSDGVPSLYTYRGYHELFSQEVDKAVRLQGRDEWVLGVSETATRDYVEAIASGSLAIDVKTHYMWDYIEHWETYLDDVDIVEPQSLAEAIELSRMLSGPDSPLARYLKAVVLETTLSKATGLERNDNSSLFDRVKRTVRSTGQDINRVVGPSLMPGQVQPRQKPELIVDSRFEALREAVGGGGDANASPLLASAQAFAELHSLLAATEAARIGGYPPPASDLPARLRGDAARLPQPGRRLLETIAASSATLVAREVRVAKGEELVGAVTRVCRETIQGRYPFAPGATEEVAIGDFTQMFGPGGRLDGYFQKELATAVDTSTSPWQLRAGAQGGLGGGASIAAFEKAQVIKDVFFRGGAGAPTVTVTIKPLVMDATITSLTLDIDGQVVRYQHGPQVAHTVTWPGGRGTGQVRVSMEPPLSTGTSGMVKEGPWALHRLLDGAQIQPGASPERFKAVLDVGGRTATFEITASSVKNPFRLSELREFNCPAGL